MRIQYFNSMYFKIYSSTFNEVLWWKTTSNQVNLCVTWIRNERLRHVILIFHRIWVNPFRIMYKGEAIHSNIGKSVIQFTKQTAELIACVLNMYLTICIKLLQKFIETLFPCKYIEICMLITQWRVLVNMVNSLSYTLSFNEFSAPKRYW